MDKTTLVNTHRPKITISAAKKMAATNIPWEEVLSELVDNAILADKSQCVTVHIRLNCDNDDDKSFIEVSDDSIGIPYDSIVSVFDLGARVNPDAFVLGKMGMGMKGAIWGIGEMEYVISKTKNGKKAEIMPALYSDLTDDLIYEQHDTNTNRLDAQESGTIVRIKRVSENLPDWRSEADFSKFVDKYNSMYANFLNDNRLIIKITYINNKYQRKIKFEAECTGSKPLMSNPRHILDADLVIGHNEPSYHEGTTEPISQIPIVTNNTKVLLTAWHKLSPPLLEEYYIKTKDSVYDPQKYKTSVFGYGHERAGIIVSYKGKLIQFGLEKESSRETDKGILIEIDDDSGLQFTQYKNTLKKNNNYFECIEAVKKYLHDSGFMIRSIAGTQQVSEREIIDKFLDYFRSDEIYLDAFKIIDFDSQVKTWVTHECGQTDIIIYDYNDPTKVTHVFEAKKDRCGADEVGQLWRYMAYHNCTKGYLLTGAKEQPSFRATFERLKKFTNLPNISIETIDVKALNTSRFFV